MKYKFLLGVALATCYIFTFTSCGTFVHGTSTKVTIKTDKTIDDNVNIVAIGPKKVVEYKNVSLPFKMKVKHNNLPLRVSMSTNEDKYEPFTIKAVRKGDGWDDLAQLFGWSAIAVGGGFAVWGLCDEAMGNEMTAAGLSEAAVGAALIGLFEFAETDIPENKFYLISSTPDKNNESWYLRFKDIQDIYTLLQEQDYLLAEAKSRWLLEQEESGELYYLKGISNHYLGELKQAIEDFKYALYLVDPEENPGLRMEIIECLEDSENARRIKKEQKQQMWANIAAGALQVGAMVAQTYAQSEYYKDLEKSGIDPATGDIKDPSKLSKEQINNLLDPGVAAKQVMHKELLEYQEFCRFNRKPDGSLYTLEEFRYFKAEEIRRLKEEEGIDVIAEQNERNRQRNKEWREGLDRDRKERLEKSKAIIRGEAYTGPSGTTNSSSNSSYSTPTNRTVTPVVTSPVSNGNTKAENPDSKQQYKNDPVSSDDYQKVKNVDLYIRDGDNARVMMKNVELCRKGAYYYIKIGNTYYPRRAPNWQRFRNAIAYGHQQLYYND